jgi:succinate dehydrogenase flavin-adding protein (antitoxin of CptAB toxin-antitoxin module)
MKNRAKVHLLPTNDERAVIGLTADEKTLWFAHSGIGNSYGNKHLYITTDDEIKEGDWYLDNQTNTIYKCDSYKESLSTDEFDEFQKIIATTDPKLHSTRLKDCPINPEDNMVSVRGLSKPPNSFIEEYCKVGGIDEVDVEYGLFHDGNFKDDDETHAFKAIRKPKVNSHNEIIIHSII